MRMHLPLLLVVVVALSPLDGFAGETQIGDVKELEGSWQGWLTREQGRERALMIVIADGSYRATTTAGSSTEGKFYLQDGKLLYRSSRTTGMASLSEDQDKTMLTMTPGEPTYGAGRAEYERVK
jgi:hypothetical protein